MGGVSAPGIVRAHQQSRKDRLADYRLSERKLERDEIRTHDFNLARLRSTPELHRIQRKRSRIYLGGTGNASDV